METVNNLRDKLSVSRFSKITGIQRSYIYYNRKSTANNIAELCRRHGVSVSNFYKWRDKFIESGKKGFYESGRSGENEYQKENERLKKLLAEKELENAMLSESLKKKMGR